MTATTTTVAKFTRPGTYDIPTTHAVIRHDGKAYFVMDDFAYNGRNEGSIRRSVCPLTEAQAEEAADAVGRSDWSAVMQFMYDHAQHLYAHTQTPPYVPGWASSI